MHHRCCIIIECWTRACNDVHASSLMIDQLAYATHMLTRFDQPTSMIVNVEDVNAPVYIVLQYTPTIYSHPLRTACERACMMMVMMVMMMMMMMMMCDEFE
jgi:hypothetical protein